MNIFAKLNAVLDYVLVIFAALISIGGFYLLTNDELLLRWLDLGRGSSRPIGWVYSLQNPSRIKPNNTNIWIDSFKGAHLHEGDTYITGENSIAELGLKTRLGQLIHLHLEPNTLVKISVEGNAFDLKLERGSLKSLFPSNIKLKINNKNANISSTNGKNVVEAKTENNEIRFEIKPVTLQTQPKALHLANEPTTELDAQKPEVIDTMEVLNFESITRETAHPPENIESPQLDFDQLAKSKATPESTDVAVEKPPVVVEAPIQEPPAPKPKPKLKIPVPQPKVAATEPPPLPKPPEKPKIELLNLQPKLDDPKDGLEIFCDQCSNNLLDFRWQKVSWAEKYQLQISEDPNFGKGQRRRYLIKNNNSTTKKLNLKPDTTYYWRVRAYSESKRSQWSKVFSFDVKLVE